MAESAQNVFQRGNEPALGWIGGLALLLTAAIVVLGIILGMAVHRAESSLRAAVIETLATRFKSRVELDAFHVSLVKGLQVEGAGSEFSGNRPQQSRTGISAIVNVANSAFIWGIRELFRSPLHVDTVYVTGLQLNLPPREHRSEMKPLAPENGKIQSSSIGWSATKHN